MGPFALSILNHKYAHTFSDGSKETWEDVARRVAWSVVSSNPKLAGQVEELIRDRVFIPGGRYLYASGRPLHQVQNCLLLRAEDSREGWADLLHKATMALMTGAGIGVDYSSVRPRGAVISRTGGHATGPLALMQIVNEAGRGIMQGGSRRSAIWAGLSWKHPDVLSFIRAKNWSHLVRQQKEEDFNFPATLDMTNISVQLDDEFFHAYHVVEHPLHDHAHQVYWTTMKQMMKTGEPGFSIDCGKYAGETLRNACTEVTSRDDSDICNLGSINMAKIFSPEQMEYVTDVCTKFLLHGTLYSDLPYAKVGLVRDKNRRLGLGLMGLHEWLMMRGLPYAPDEDLEELLAVYQSVSDRTASAYADELGVSRPVAVRAIAPTGSIGILAECAGTGIEPVYCAAYKRRYLKGEKWEYQYVIDPAIKRLVNSGVDPEQIEDAYTLAEDPMRRVRFQVWVQGFVDQGISSTLNLPAWGTKHNNEGVMQKLGEELVVALPFLRGLTCYPDGARGGQPLSPVDYTYAVQLEGEVFEETVSVCDITKGGSCGE